MTEVSLTRSVSPKSIKGGSAALLAGYNLQRHVIYRCVVGSRAYGLDDSESDVDRRGIYLPPAELHWSLYGVPEQLEYNATEEVYWGSVRIASPARNIERQDLTDTGEEQNRA